MNVFMKSIFAGVMIGIACLVNLHVDTNWVGAILFSVGLIVISLRGFKLFTGAVGYADSYKDISYLTVCFFGNVVGLIAVALASDVTAGTIVVNKLQAPLYLSLFKGIWCGFLMFMSVDIYKDKKSIIGILFCVPAFILAGFEHSIADAFYIILSKEFTEESMKFLLTVITGNVLGAQIGRISKYM